MADSPETPAALLVLNYQLTYDDYVEAQRAHQSQIVRKSRLSPVFAWVSVIGLVFVLISMVWSMDHAEPVDGLIDILPLIVLVALRVVLLTAYRRDMAMNRFLLVVIGCATIAAAVTLALFRDPSKSLISGFYISWMALSSAAVGTWLGLFIRWLRSDVYSKNWRNMPNLQSPKRTTIGGEGIQVCDALNMHQCKWPGLSRYLETPNLVLLYASRQSFHMIPKRAFNATEDFRRFMELVQHHLEKKVRGFPVMPKPSPN